MMIVKPLIFKYWLEKWNITHHNKTLRNVEIFLDSKEYRFETNNLNYTT